VIRRVLAVSCVALGAVSFGYSQLVDVAFVSDSYGYTQATGPAVIGSAGDQWNEIDGDPGSGSGIALNDSLGNATSVQLSYSSISAIISANTSPTNPDQPLMHDYLYSDSAGIQVGLSGLTPNQAYQLILFVSSDDASNGSRAVTGNANGVNFAATGDPQAGVFVNGGNYAGIASVAADASGNLAISVNEPASGNSDNEVDVNGLQLQPVPEPASLTALAVGALFLRRRKRLIGL